MLSVPDSYSASDPMPLVFAWHGLGGSGEIASMYFGVERPSAGQAIFVYPDGLPLDSQGGSAGWDLAADGIDVQFFDAMLSALSGEYCVDASRVFATGHSYGGFFSNALGCARADVLRAIAPVAGGPPFGGGTCTTPIAAWLAHGTNDETVDFEQFGVAARDMWIAANGCSTTTEPTSPAECVAYQGCTAGHPVVWCVHESGHDWPSFAGEAIWDFFASF